MSDGETGVTVFCHGCGAGGEAVCAKLGIDIADLFFTPRNGSHTNGHAWRAPDISYEIRDAEGGLIATHHRFEARDGKPKKLLWQANGKWNLGGLRLADLPLLRQRAYGDLVRRWGHRVG